MRLLLAILALLYSPVVTTKQLNAEWWWSLGYCTKTDKRELGGCGQLEIKRRPSWHATTTR